MSEELERFRLQVTPEPSDEEMAAIAAAITALVSRNGGEAPSRETGGGRERWAQAARRELLRPFARDEAIEGTF